MVNLSGTILNEFSSRSYAPFLNCSLPQTITIHPISVWKKWTEVWNKFSEVRLRRAAKLDHEHMLTARRLSRLRRLCNTCGRVKLTEKSSSYSELCGFHTLSPSCMRVGLGASFLLGYGGGESRKGRAGEKARDTHMNYAVAQERNMYVPGVVCVHTIVFVGWSRDAHGKEHATKQNTSRRRRNRVLLIREEQHCHFPQYILLSIRGVGSSSFAIQFYLFWFSRHLSKYSDTWDWNG